MDRYHIKGFSKAHYNTPEVIVINNSGLVVRQLAYYRKEAEKAAQLRVSLQVYDTQLI